MLNVVVDVVVDVATLEFDVVTLIALLCRAFGILMSRLWNFDVATLICCRDSEFRCHDITLSIFNVSAWL